MSLDAILTTAWYQLELSEIRILDPSQSKQEINFFIDFSMIEDDQLIDERYLWLEDSAWTFEVLPWFPSLAPDVLAPLSGSKVAVWNATNDEILLLLAFSAAIPLGRIRIDAIQLGSSLWQAAAVSHPSSTSIEAVF